MREPAWSACVAYYDRDRDFSWQTLRVADPSVGTSLNPARLSSIGVTSQAHAAILARFHLAQSIYQRKDITFDTDLEHLTYKRMSVMALTHDVTQWGYGGRLDAVTNNGGILTLTLDDEVPAGAGPRYIGLRVPGEVGYRVFGVNSFAGSSRTITLSSAWPGGVPVPGATANNPACDTIWIYDFKATPGYKVRVTGIQPQAGMMGATVTAVPEGPEFWSYVFNGTYTPPANQSLLPSSLPQARDPIVTEELVRQDNTFYVDLTVTFYPEGNFDHAEVWASYNGGPLVWVDVTRTNTLTWRASIANTVTVQVRPMDTLGRLGPVASKDYDLIGLASPAYSNFGRRPLPGNVETFAITNGVLSWSPVVSADLAGYVIWFQYGENPTWSNAAPLHEGVITQSPFKPELIPPSVCTLLIKAVDSAGNESENAASIVANLGDVIVENVILTYDDKAAGFPGQKTNCAVVGGNLLANDTGGVYWLDDDAAHYSRTAEAYWATVSYAPLEYITN